MTAQHYQPFDIVQLGRSLTNPWQFILGRSQIAEGWNDTETRNALQELARISPSLTSVAKTVVIENFYICKDYRAQRRNQHPFWPPKSPKEFCTRLHWLKDCRQTLERILNDPALDVKASYLGYTVLTPVPRSIYGRSVLCIDQLKENAVRYYAITNCETVTLGGRKIEFRGFPWTSQNRPEFVCTGAALWNLYRYLSDSQHHIPEKYPTDFTEHKKIAQNIELFEKHNFSVHQQEALEHPRFEEDLYAYTESGLAPVYAHHYTGAQLPDHAITIIGHTHDREPQSAMNEARPKIHAWEFIKQLVVVDDNYTPYRLLGQHGEDTNYGMGYFRGRRRPTTSDVCFFLCPLPRQVRMKSKTAIDASEPVLEAIRTRYFRSQVVVRHYLTSSNAFKHAKWKSAGSEPINKTLCLIQMPKYIWVVEMGTTENFIRSRTQVQMVLNANTEAPETMPLNRRPQDIVSLQVGQNLIGDVDEIYAPRKTLATDPFKHHITHPTEEPHEKEHS